MLLDFIDFPLLFIGFSLLQPKKDSNFFLGRRKRRAQAEELRSSFFSNEVVSDTMNHKGSADFSPLGVRAVALVRDTVVKIKRKFNLLGYSTFETLSGERLTFWDTLPSKYYQAKV